MREGCGETLRDIQGEKGEKGGRDARTREFSPMATRTPGRPSLACEVEFNAF